MNFITTFEHWILIFPKQFHVLVVTIFPLCSHRSAIRYLVLVRLWRLQELLSSQKPRKHLERKGKAHPSYSREKQSRKMVVPGQRISPAQDWSTVCSANSWRMLWLGGDVRKSSSPTSPYQTSEFAFGLNFIT